MLEEAALLTYTTIWEIADRSKYVKQVELGIFERLQDLVRLQLFVLNSGLVILQSDHSHTLLVI